MVFGITRNARHGEPRSEEVSHFRIDIRTVVRATEHFLDEAVIYPRLKKGIRQKRFSPLPANVRTYQQLSKVTANSSMCKRYIVMTRHDSFDEGCDNDRAVTNEVVSKAETEVLSASVVRSIVEKRDTRCCVWF